MSEEEILKECTELAENEHHELGDCWDEEYSSSAIFGLIMLYKQTKKELNNLKEIEKSHQQENGKLRVELEQEKEKNKDLEEKLKIAVAMLTKGTYPEENEGDNDFDKQFIAVDKIKEKIQQYKCYEGLEVYEKYHYKEMVLVLQQLLEEK